MKQLRLVLLAVMLMTVAGGAQPVAGGAQPVAMMQLSTEERQWFRNPDGSCVQCSIGMCGVHCNVPEATTLLWDTVYGPRVRGGSSPSRVADYCNARGIRAYNVTGTVTWEWMRWAARTGRFAAIGAGAVHFQTLYGYDPNTNTYFVCNNNSPQRIDKYNEQQFKQLHLASGQWCVVLKQSAPENPVYVEWWK